MKVHLEVLEDPHAPYIKELISIQKELLPIYDWNPCNMATIRTDNKNRPNVEIIVGFHDNEAAGFMQICYIYHYDKVFVNVDFIAVLPEFRRSGLGLILLRSLKSIKQIDGYKFIGVIGLAEVENANDPFSYKRLFLYSRLGAQIRRDIIYRTPDYPNAYVVFWPASKEFSDISTVAIAWQLWRISQYNTKQFRKHIADINYSVIRTELSKY